MYIYMLSQVRQCLQAIGAAADVPIEPTEMKGLLDNTMSLPGVIFAGVPGAGGFDAVFALLLSDTCVAHVEQMWEAAPESLRLLDTTCAQEGIKIIVKNAQ